MPILMSIAENWVLDSQDMEWNAFKNPAILCKPDFFWQSKYDRIFRQVTNKWDESAIKYIRRFKNTQTLSV